ncbi:hypothetical protein [Clostridium sp.]|jgi:hypothetical protein|uniref:hypothetical protein n=1 Tax=Clostridium sp. TaxID=1506 RepID=UPI002585ED04|nr:hypothetical protein [Clostridium sp.]MDF2504907.1 hypothetical protein [Clostridium sp.]
MENEILELLKDINSKLDGHTQILNDHSKVLEEHTEILNAHTKVLDKHTKVLDENTQILRALEHSSEVHKAEIDKANYVIANVEGNVKGIRQDLTAVEMITSKNWNDISKLKAVK